MNIMTSRPKVELTKNLHHVLFFNQRLKAVGHFDRLQLRQFVISSFVNLVASNHFVLFILIHPVQACYASLSPGSCPDQAELLQGFWSCSFSVMFRFETRLGSDGTATGSTQKNLIPKAWYRHLIINICRIKVGPLKKWSYCRYL